MSFDLIVRGGTLPDGRVADIGISGERILEGLVNEHLVGARSS